MLKVFKILISYVVGILSGMVILLGTQVFIGRDGSFGGEILILPLFIMLVAIGYWIAQDIQENKYQRGRQEGYWRAVRDLTEALKNIKQ